MESIKRGIRQEVDHYGRKWVISTWICFFIGVAANVYQAVGHV